MPAGAFDAVRLTGAGPLLGARVFALPPGTGPAGSGQGGIGVSGSGLTGTGPAALETAGGFGNARSAADDVLTVPFAVDGAPHLIAVGTADALSTLALSVSAQKGRDEGLPPWLAADAATNGQALAARIADAERDTAARRAEIAALSRAHALPAALAVARRLEWVLANVRALETTDLFCRITGWTSDVAGERVAAALDASAARALLHFPAPPRRAHAPLLFANPWWARPYEIFTRALGMPAQDEADPSVLLAVAVPLLFGYMFGDVGQGAVLAVAGWALRHRHPIAKLVFVGGLAAIVFGFAFGSVFGLHILAPLWVQPLAEPLRVLAAPIVGGAVLLTLGLVLGAIEAHWRHAVRRVAGHRRAVPGRVHRAAGERRRYGCAAASPPAAFVALLRGPRLGRAARAAAALAAIAEFVERMVQLLINTLSFARVGAFALAHAGLSSAIAALIAGADALWLQGAGADPRQRADPGARGDGRVDPDHAPGAVRVLHPLPHRGGAGPSGRCRRPLRCRRRPEREIVMKRTPAFVAALVALAAALALGTTALLLAPPPSPPPRRVPASHPRPGPPACTPRRRRPPRRRSAPASRSPASAPPRSARWPRSPSSSAGC